MAPAPPSRPLERGHRRVAIDRPRFDAVRRRKSRGGAAGRMARIDDGGCGQPTPRLVHAPPAVRLCARRRRHRLLVGEAGTARADARYRVALVATGHLHKWRDATIGDCRYVWCASSGFLVGPDNQPDMPGEKRLGATVYDFDGRDVSVAHHDIPGLSTYWIDDVIHEVYPPRQAA